MDLLLVYRDMALPAFTLTPSIATITSLKAKLDGQLRMMGEAYMGVCRDSKRQHKTVAYNEGIDGLLFKFVKYKLEMK